MNAREQIAERLWWSVPSSDDADAKAKASAMLDAFAAEVVAERDAQIIAWLGKKAREYQGRSGPRAESASDALARMADKISRGAIRPTATEQGPAPQPGAAALAHGGLTALSWWQHQTPPTAATAPQPETAPDAPAVGDRYDCRHGGEGVTVTRLWALDNGHRAVDFEYRDGESSALPLDSFRRAYRPEAAPDGDEWVRCSGLHCPNAERFTKATERGWQPGRMGTWQCPTCATGAES